MGERVTNLKGKKGKEATNAILKSADFHLTITFKQHPEKGLMIGALFPNNKCNINQFLVYLDLAKGHIDMLKNKTLKEMRG